MSFLLPEIYIGLVKRFSPVSDLSFSLFLSKSTTNSAIPPSNLYSDLFSIFLFLLHILKIEINQLLPLQ